MRHTLALGLAAAMLAALPSTAFAASGSSAAGEGTLSVGDAWLPTVASDSRGHVVAAWYAETDSDLTVAARLSSDGGAHWGRAQSLGTASLSQADERPSLIRAAVDAHGDAIVVWSRLVSGHMTVVAATASPDRGFRAALTVSNAGVGAHHPTVAASRQHFVVAWSGDTTVEDAVVSATGNVTSSNTIARGQSRPDEVSVAADSERRVALAWNVSYGTTDGVVVARQTIGSAVGAATTLTKKAVGGPIGVAVSGTGQTTVTWTELQNATTDSEVVEASSAAWDMDFSASQQLSASGMLAICGGEGGGSRGIGIDDAGHVSVVWVEVVPFGVRGGGRVAVATSDSAGGFAPARTLQTVKDPLSYERPAIAVAPWGSIVATWTLYTTYSDRPSGGVWAARASGNGAFSSPIAVSGVSGDASAVATSKVPGDAVIVWGFVDPSSGSYSVQFRYWTLG